MSVHKKISIGSYKAVILSEVKFAQIRKTGADKPSVKIDAPARITKSWLNAAKAMADSAGLDVSEVTTARYIRYMLRSVLVERSGMYSTDVIYTKSANGTWSKKTVMTNNVY